MRKLASIQRILSLSPIDGADRIEKATVLGWNLVVKKGEFSAGDLCCYIEIDSIPPDNDIFSFLWKTDACTTRPENFRIKTKKLKGVVSQGLALPISVLGQSSSRIEGEDITDELGISKWEPAITSSSREIEGPFPTHLFRKTDEIRVQSAPAVLDELRGKDCYTAVKMDGQSLTFAKYFDGGHIVNRVCSRNFMLKDIPGSPHWEIARRHQIFEKMSAGFAVQCEFVGPGIQSNRLGLKDKAIFAFQVFDIVNQKYLDFDNFISFCNLIDVPTVPIECIGPLNLTLESALLAAEGKYQNGHPREGIVVRPTKECRSAAIEAAGGGSRASFKVINNLYLLKIGE